MAMGGGSASSMPQGLGPSAQASFDIGQKQLNQALPDIKKYGLQMSKLATGGLLQQGMNAVDKSMNVPSVAPGMMDRTMARYGLAETPQMRSQLQNQNALADAANKVAVKNGSRDALWDQQMALQFGGGLQI